jgi:hypothetical protein
MVGITSILREAWNTSANTEDRREKIQALSLAKECYSMKLDLLTNASVVDDAIRFVSEYSIQERLKSTASSNKEDESKELKHREKRANEQEEATTNHVF